jgi:hypothetical protein
LTGTDPATFDCPLLSNPDMTARTAWAEIDPFRPSEPNLFDHVVSDGKELRRQFDTERQPNL